MTRSILNTFATLCLRGSAPMALAALMLFQQPASAAVTNTVTATASGPGGPITSTATESVDLVDNAPALVVVRSWAFVPGPTGDVNGNGLVDAGDQIVYSYVVQNSGNVTLKDVTAANVHDGLGAALTLVVPTSVTTDNGSASAGTLGDSTDVSATSDGDWDVLGPNDYVTFTSGPYTVVPADLSAPTSLDSDIDGTVTASGNYDPGASPITVTATASGAVPLNVVPALTISKVASSDTNVPAGTVVTYTYRVKNTGTVALTNVQLHDTHKGVLDALVPAFASWATNTGSTIAGNTITTLAPGDEAIFTATYTVTQADVDTLQ